MIKHILWSGIWVEADYSFLQCPSNAHFWVQTAGYPGLENYEFRGVQLKLQEVQFQKSEVRKRFITTYVYTHKEFELATGASSAEESTDIVQTYMIVQTYAVEMEYNTNIIKTENLILHYIQK